MWLALSQCCETEPTISQKYASIERSGRLCYRFSYGLAAQLGKLMKVPTFTAYNYKIMWLLPKFLEFIYHSPFSLPKKLNWTSSDQATPIFYQPLALPLRHPKFLSIEWSFQKLIWSGHLSHAHPQRFKHFQKSLIDLEDESCSVMSDSAIPWTRQSTEFSRPEYWSG